MFAEGDLPSDIRLNCSARIKRHLAAEREREKERDNFLLEFFTTVKFALVATP